MNPKCKINTWLGSVYARSKIVKVVREFWARQSVVDGQHFLAHRYGMRATKTWNLLKHTNVWYCCPMRCTVWQGTFDLQLSVPSCKRKTKLYVVWHLNIILCSKVLCSRLYLLPHHCLFLSCDLWFTTHLTFAVYNMKFLPSAHTPHHDHTLWSCLRLLQVLKVQNAAYHDVRVAK